MAATSRKLESASRSRPFVESPDLGRARSLRSVKIGTEARAKTAAVMSIVPAIAPSAVRPSRSRPSTSARQAPSVTRPPQYPNDHPQPETFPTASGRAISGRNAELSVSPTL